MRGLCSPRLGPQHGKVAGSLLWLLQHVQGVRSLAGDCLTVVIVVVEGKIRGCLEVSSLEDGCAELPVAVDASKQLLFESIALSLCPAGALQGCVNKRGPKRLPLGC
jgi:hypothetical protein